MATETKLNYLQIESALIATEARLSAQMDSMVAGLMEEYGAADASWEQMYRQILTSQHKYIIAQLRESLIKNPSELKQMLAKMSRCSSFPKPIVMDCPKYEKK